MRLSQMNRLIDWTREVLGCAREDVEIRDERALHILLHQSKQTTRQPRVSLSLVWSLSPNQTDDKMWRDGLTRREGGRWRENRLLDSMGVLTS